MKAKSLIIGSLLFQAILLNAQKPLTLDVKSNMTITGTSTLHDWESDVTQINLSGTGIEINGKISEIRALTLTVPVKSIKSGKDLMDDKTLEALLAELYPTVKLSVESVHLFDGKISGKGNLTISGITKEVSLAATYSQTGSTLEIKGTQNIDMLLYGVIPPKVLMGSIATGKDITIPYHLIIHY
ncbi:MAG: YceI family protein [Salinivirgaceae bacterium]|jgi:polyisoprenoid-binding protein YceI